MDLASFDSTCKTVLNYASCADLIIVCFWGETSNSVNKFVHSVKSEAASVPSYLIFIFAPFCFFLIVSQAQGGALLTAELCYLNKKGI